MVPPAAMPAAKARPTSRASIPPVRPGYRRSLTFTSYW